MPRVRCPLQDCTHWSNDGCCAPELNFSRRGNGDMEIGKIGHRGELQGKCPSFKRHVP